MTKAGETARALPIAIVDLLSRSPRPMHVREIGTKLEVSRHQTLRDAIDRLVDEGVLIPLSGQRYRVAEQATAERGRDLEGVLSAHPRGFAFVKIPGDDDDIYVTGEALAGAMHGDRVRVRVVSRGRRGLEGEILEVLKRGRDRVTGVIRSRGRWLELDDGRVRGPVELDPPADAQQLGKAAVATITRYPLVAGENPRGELFQVLGEPGDPDVEVSKILIEHHIDEEHPAAAVEEAQAFGDTIADHDVEGRIDLRELPLITIDPSDARDHDDAVWVERDERGGYRAWVAIADVAAYVRPDSALDRSALMRGNSVYLPDRAVPMLPRALSSELCSLLPGAERLCLCVELELDPTAAVRKTHIYEAVMRSGANLSYESVARALGFTVEPARNPEAEERRHELQVMWELASELRKRRMRRGALDFDLPEARIQIDEATRAPISISQRSHDPGVRKAYRLVEEMMLLANESVARFMIERDLPTVFRVHGAPDPDKIERFATLCRMLGLRFDIEDAEEPKSLQKVLRKIAGHDKQQILHMLLLRAMQQAAYTPRNIGHFGLASEAYLHFTSPIRRYPDLVVHRLLKQQLARGDRALADDERAPLEERLDEAAATASERERTTLDAERQIADLYRALYMRSHLGGIFQGTVVAIVTSGVFVRLDDPFVDVMVPNDALGPGGHEMDESGLAVVGLYSGERIELGSDMSVEVEEASLVRRVVLAKRVQRSERRLSKKERRQVRRRSAAQARKGHGGGKRGGGKRGGGRSGGGKRSGGKRGGGKRGGGGRRR